MRILAVFAVVASCAGPTRAVAPTPAPAPVRPTTAAPDATIAKPPTAAKPLDEATVKTMSYAYFDALDRHDVAASSPLLAPGFIASDEAMLYDRKEQIEKVQGHADRKLPPWSRTWLHEIVSFGEASAVYIGEVREHRSQDYDSRETLVWVRDGADWKVAYDSRTKAGIARERERWNESYRKAQGFKQTVNQLLVDAVKARKAGAALDLASGQGRNALYLAAHGWRVTAVDISDVGLRIALETAAKKQLKLETIDADIYKWDFGTDKWDLVTMLYAGADAKVVDKAKASLKKGGLFVVEYFHADSEIARDGAGGFKTGELAATFKDGFKIVRDDVIDDVADWGQTKTKLVRFVAQKL